MILFLMSSYLTAIRAYPGCELEVYTILFCIDDKKKPEISHPTHFEHTIHVGFDPNTGEFTVRYIKDGNTVSVPAYSILISYKTCSR